MKIIKRFKNYFQTQSKSEFRNIISFDSAKLRDMEDDVLDIFAAPIDDCDDFYFDYIETMEGVFMQLKFKYNFRAKLKVDSPVSEEYQDKMNIIVSNVRKCIKKLIQEFNTKENRVVNVDMPGFIHNNSSTIYVISIWRYKSTDEN